MSHLSEMTLLLPGPPGHSGDAHIDRCGAPVTRPLPATSDHQVALDDMLRDGDRLSILVWRYHDDDLPGADAAVPLKLRGLPRAFSRGAVLTHYRIDGRHLNSFATWQAMGSPLAPADAQRAALLRAARLATIARAGARRHRQGAGKPRLQPAPPEGLVAGPDAGTGSGDERPAAVRPLIGSTRTRGRPAPFPAGTVVAARGKVPAHGGPMTLSRVLPAASAKADDGRQDHESDAQLDPARG